MSDLKIGVIGYGMRGELSRHAEHPGEGSHIAAVCEPTERGRQKAHERYGDDHTVYVSDLAQLLKLDLDAVMVLTPDYNHAEIAIQTLKAGLATFCEKPMAIRLEDCDAMLQTAYDNKTRLYIGHNMRHMSVIRQMKEIIDSGRIGRVRAIWCRHFVGAGGDFYFKDWHADRSKANTLLLQKGAHDIDVIHWLAGGYTSEVSGIGDLMIYGDITDRRDNSDRRMGDWYSLDNWPPTAQKELNPIVDVEDISMLNMVLDNGVLANYEQCHFTPDYWRNYTVIGDAGRIENMGDEAGDFIYVWTSRRGGAGRPDDVVVVDRNYRGYGGHGGADPKLVGEFVRFAREGGKTHVSAVAARQAVATGCLGADSLRTDHAPRRIPALDPELRQYFDDGQV